METSVIDAREVNVLLGNSMRLGPCEVHAVDDGRFSLDGGAMFGVVPRAIWERSDPPDRENRIRMALRCLLIKVDERVILVDTGIGSKWTPKELERFAIDRSEGGIVASLAARGLAPEQITDVVLTHLHFDHAGGVVSSDGSLTFPNATHWLQRRNLAHALHPTVRDKASYLRPCFDPLLRSSKLRLLDGPTELAAGVDVLLFEGHTVGQQLVRVRDPAQRAAWLLYGADIIPSSSHLSAAFVMGYDLTPDVTAREKARIVARAERENAILVFEHDPNIAAATVRLDQHGRPVVRDAVAAL